jgi:hypothetical protein
MQADGIALERPSGGPQPKGRMGRFFSDARNWPAIRATLRRGARYSYANNGRPRSGSGLADLNVILAPARAANRVVVR